MARTRVKLAYITNDATRKGTYKKRKKGLVKKASKLSTLCDVEACVVIYFSTCDSQPEVWPSIVTTHRMLSNFKEMPAMGQSNKMVNLVKKRIAKIEEQLRRLRGKNRRKELTQVMYQNLGRNGLNTVKEEDLNDLSWLIDQNVNVIDNMLHMRIESFVLQEK
ncbi:hypothetical protein V6N13_018336 [Hibiscus sabdariffa]|uniref:MADS-box domain-containing protein n=2 Tax=Hibiscus sabdariffa TaxID=183260 RepID=A0ABR1ZGB7_9ROSI